jgi:hypothetical protein
MGKHEDMRSSCSRRSAELSYLNERISLSGRGGDDRRDNRKSAEDGRLHEADGGDRAVIGRANQDDKPNKLPVAAINFCDCGSPVPEATGEPVSETATAERTLSVP